MGSHSPTIRSQNKNLNLIGIIINVLFVLIMILPARAFQTYALVHISSDLSCDYLNLIDLLLVMLIAIGLIGKRKIKLTRSEFGYLALYCLIAITGTMCMIASEKANYAAETISKFIILFGALYYSDLLFSDDSTNPIITKVYAIPLITLSSATLLLGGYMSYGVSNRTGTLGFGSNEAAMFAVTLLSFSLFSKNNKNIIKVIGIVLSVLALLAVASTRGMLVGIAVFFLFVISILLKKKKFTASSLIGTVVVFFLFVYLIYINYERILSYILTSDLANRIIFKLNNNMDIIDFSGRTTIFEQAIELIKNDLFLFGTFGSDKLLANEFMHNTIHTHNIVLQFLSTYGVVNGIMILVPFVYTFIISINNIFKIVSCKENRNHVIMLSFFYALYFVFDMFGYLLWNPKGLLWVLITMILLLRQNSVDKRKAYL